MRLFGKPAPPPETKDATTAFFRPSLQPGRPYRSNWDGATAMRTTIERNVWVYRACQAIASNQAKLPVEVRQGAKDGDPIEGHFLVPLLNGTPNPYERAVAFRSRLSMQLLMSRRGVFIEVIRDVTGDPIELYLLPPDRTAPVPSATKYVDWYEVDMGAQKVRKETEDVIWIRLPHPLDPYASLTPLEAAGIAIDVDWMAHSYNRNFLARDGRPGGILNLAGDLDQDVKEEMEFRFQGGPAEAGRVSVINSEEATFVDTATSPRDAQYVEALALTKVEILAAFGTPETIIGNASGRTFDNASTEREVFWGETMPPHLSMLESGFDVLDGDDSTFVMFNTDGEWSAQLIQQRKKTSLLEEVAKGVISINTYREETGRAKLDVPEADQYFMAAGTAPIFSDTAALPAVRAPLTLIERDEAAEEMIPLAAAAKLLQLVAAGQARFPGGADGRPTQDRHQGPRPLGGDVP